MLINFLSKKKQRQLAILQSLFTNTTNGFPYLVKEFDITEVQLTHDIQDINKTVQTIAHQKLVDTSNKHNYTVNIDDIHLYQQLEFHYLNDSLTFQICSEIITHRHLPFNNLCDKLAISTSHCYRVLKQLNSILDQFNIVITIDQHTVPVFTGNEINIRVFIFSFVKYCFPRTNWPFPTISRAETISDFNLLSPNNKLAPSFAEEITLLLAVMKIRLSKSYFAEPMSEYVQTLLQKFVVSDYNTFKSLFFQKKMTDNNIIKVEFFYLNFFAHLLLPNLIEENHAISLGTIISHSHLSADIFVNKLTAKWQERFNLDLASDDLAKVKYFCLIFYVLAFHIHLNIIKILKSDATFLNDKRTINTAAMHDIRSFLTTTLPTIGHNNPCRDLPQDFAIDYFSNLFFFSTQTYKQQQVTIYMHFADYSVREFLKTKLKTIYTPLAVKTVDNINTADIILTDTFDIIVPNKKCIVIRNVFNPQELQTMLTAIDNSLFLSAKH
ncbi:helix-turn-helix domain-containing protein [Leuconostoc gasicomitatum]|uniref:helix-turn-helix domain-containing protein n=1 Tax=Leuconostoc gasicomitatum TaxID=115778 RepID=UPI0007E22CCA|nr:helix-turn-helix domain-containing protein [Leuconostoc gasicomitatum]CUW09079.1 hypothetical protein PB1E_1024 [Leuconostoc gasicomitatum]